MSCLGITRNRQKGQFAWELIPKAIWSSNQPFCQLLAGLWLLRQTHSPTCTRHLHQPAHSLKVFTPRVSVYPDINGLPQDSLIFSFTS